MLYGRVSSKTATTLIMALLHHYHQPLDVRDPLSAHRHLVDLPKLSVRPRPIARHHRVHKVLPTIHPCTVPVSLIVEMIPGMTAETKVRIAPLKTEQLRLQIVKTM